MNWDVPDFVPRAWSLAWAVGKLTENLRGVLADDLRIPVNPDIDLDMLRDKLRRLDDNGDA